MPEVIGLGAMNLDHLYAVRSIVIDTEDVVDEFNLYPGGSAANTIYGLAKLGVAAGFVGIVGDDSDGRALIADLQAAGVDTSNIKITKDAPTGAVLGLSDRLGRRSLYIAPGANNLLSYDNIPTEYVQSAQYLHLSSFVHESQFGVISRLVPAVPSSLKISFAPGSLYSARGLKGLDPILARTHILFLNKEEMENLSGSSYVKGARECLKRGCNTVVVTMGAGLAVTSRKTIIAYVRDDRNEYEIEPSPMMVATQPETTGAGDAFSAGFLFGLIKSKNIIECGLLGDLMARFSITKKGARAGLPSLPKLAEKFREYSGKVL